MEPAILFRFLLTFIIAGTCACVGSIREEIITHDAGPNDVGVQDAGPNDVGLKDAGLNDEGALLFHAEEKDAVEVTSAAELEFGQVADKKWTIEGWIRIDQILAGAVFSKRWTLDPAQTDYMLWVQPDLGLVWATGSPDDECAWLFVEMPDLGEWHHVAMTIEGATENNGHKAFFLNGVLQKECDYAHKGPAHDDDLLIGAAEHLLLFHGVHDYFSGAIDELHFNASILYQEDFSPAFRLEIDENTLAFWDFSLDEEGMLPDLSGHGHHGEVFGAQSINATR